MFLVSAYGTGKEMLPVMVGIVLSEWRFATHSVIVKDSVFTNRRRNCPHIRNDARSWTGIYEQSKCRTNIECYMSRAT